MCDKVKVIKNMEIKIKTKQQVEVQNTLLSLRPDGKPVTIKTKDIKASSIRSGIRELNAKGYSFESTERGLVDEVKVTRLK